MKGMGDMGTEEWNGLRIEESLDRSRLGLRPANLSVGIVDVISQIDPI